MLEVEFEVSLDVGIWSFSIAWLNRVEKWCGRCMA
jgi:hypothetical protein